MQILLCSHGWPQIPSVVEDDLEILILLLLPLRVLGLSIPTILSNLCYVGMDPIHVFMNGRQTL